MKRTVQDGFEEFITRLTPQYSEPEKAELNLTAIERVLKSEFTVQYIANYGSTGHGTNVDGYSAIDCFAVVPKDALIEESSRSLDKVHSALVQQFPDAVVTEGRSVIAVPFGPQRAECHHVVPVFSKGQKEGFDIYGVPAPRDRWIDACPGGHSAWLNELNHELANQLKPFVRIVKAWNFYENEPLWSFYLELCAAEFLSSRPSVSYSSDVQDFFEYLLRRRLAPFKGSVGCTEPVYGSSLADKFESIAKVRSAAEKAKQAYGCEMRGNIPDAYFWWRKLFNYKFTAF
jgi:hypothetical protein